ncbi:circadian clock protein KaiC [Aquisalimonas lutea]|uniref:circadian clock protein KaiC n=1 Tax=Aquisalimonas lutea TaxID=1327750 RepID=UPI0025B4A24B|nr:circadian clock protein KaiC [Aquisalimonas lutea]MDN3519708.1 circadian clock protein KaiC [Aquisalimonas lutea]
MTTHTSRLIKQPTHIAGLDALTVGGLPASGTTLVIGQPSAGKTVLGLQLLAEALDQQEGGIFVSFEESQEQIRRSTESFAWGAHLTNADEVRFIDARPPMEATAAGAFDLEGLLALIAAQAEQGRTAWVVFDGIDQLLRMQPDEHTAAMQIRHLDTWCRDKGLAAILTAKQTYAGRTEAAYLEGVEFLLSTILVLSTELVGRRLNRRFRIAKYRGSAHETDEVAMVLDNDGIHLPYSPHGEGMQRAQSIRVGSGIPRLDSVLGGGVYCGSSILISGQPGTAKTTLAVCFAQAAAQRGERVLYISFDELADRIVRNVSSVGIDLQPQLDKDLLHIESREAWSALVEEHYIAIVNLLDQLNPACVVIDPVSALLKANSAESAFDTTERLIALFRRRGITTILTSLSEQGDVDNESTLSHVSTLADTWITLDYRIHGGERNRALSVVKSRGSAHSNQVRELLLSDAGPDLADVYEYGSQVLMGTARVQKESEEAAKSRAQSNERDHRRRTLQRELEAARLRRQDAENEAQRYQDELDREEREAREAQQESDTHQGSVIRRRDPSDQARPSPDRWQDGES